MSTATSSYPAHLITAQADSGKASGSLFTWLFGGAKTKNVATSAPKLADSPLPIVRNTKAAPIPTVLRIPESVAAELMHALQPRGTKFVANRQFGVTRLQTNQEQPSPVQFRSRQFSTSVLETEDRGFPIV